MAKRDPERARKLEVAVAYLVRTDQLQRGYQSRLGELFKVSRQRVHQIVVQERQQQNKPEMLS